MPNIAFIGLGTMGSPMAKRLINSGFKLSIFDISKNSLSKFEKDNVFALSGPLVDVETLYAAKIVLSRFGINNLECRSNKSEATFSQRAEWLFNEGINGIDRIDKLLIVGADVKREAPTLNSRIRQRWLTGNLEIRGMCVPEELNYELKSYGNDRPLIKFDGSAGFNGDHSHIEISGLEISGINESITYNQAMAYRPTQNNYFSGRGISI